MTAARRKAARTVRLATAMPWMAGLCRAGLVALISAHGAQAQTGPQIRPGAEPQAVILGDQLPTEHLTGEWGGMRTSLAGRGIDLGFVYESQTAGVVSGGLRRGVDYTQSVDVAADVDWAKLVGLRGLSTHIGLVERAGRNASRDYVGEQVNQVQQLYGGGGDVLTHLVYLYAEQKLLDSTLNVKAGRLYVNRDFATSPIYCEFLSLSFCPGPRPLVLQDSFTVFPNSTWGGRVQGSPMPSVYLEAGAYQVRPQFGGRSGLNWSLNGTTGVSVPVELGWEPRFGGDQLQGHYKVGGLYDTSAYPDLSAGQYGSLLMRSSDTGNIGRRQGQAMAYTLVDQMILRTGPNGTDGVIAFAGYAYADPRTAAIGQEAFGGIYARGVIPARPGDSIGVSASWFEASRYLTATQKLQRSLGKPVSAGLGTSILPSGDVQGHEIVLEARYAAKLSTGILLTSDLQYVIRPNETAQRRSAAVAGLQVLLDF